eukprot:5546867-Pyramimonas_sp.AAC.1
MPVTSTPVRHHDACNVHADARQTRTDALKNIHTNTFNIRNDARNIQTDTSHNIHVDVSCVHPDAVSTLMPVPSTPAVAEHAQA